MKRYAKRRTKDEADDSSSFMSDSSSDKKQNENFVNKNHKKKNRDKEYDQGNTDKLSELKKITKYLQDLKSLISKSIKVENNKSDENNNLIKDTNQPIALEDTN